MTALEMDYKRQTGTTYVKEKIQAETLKGMYYGEEKIEKERPNGTSYVEKIEVERQEGTATK